MCRDGREGRESSGGKGAVCLVHKHSSWAERRFPKHPLTFFWAQKSPRDRSGPKLAQTSVARDSYSAEVLWGPEAILSSVLTSLPDLEKWVIKINQQKDFILYCMSTCNQTYNTTDFSSSQWHHPSSVLAMSSPIKIS